MKGTVIGYKDSKCGIVVVASAAVVLVGVGGGEL
jgi:hypothetical protein